MMLVRIGDGQDGNNLGRQVRVILQVGYSRKIEGKGLLVFSL